MAILGTNVLAALAGRKNPKYIVNINTNTQRCIIFAVTLGVGMSVSVRNGQSHTPIYDIDNDGITNYRKPPQTTANYRKPPQTH